MTQQSYAGVLKQGNVVKEKTMRKALGDITNTPKGKKMSLKVKEEIADVGAKQRERIKELEEALSVTLEENRMVRMHNLSFMSILSIWQQCTDNFKIKLHPTLTQKTSTTMKAPTTLKKLRPSEILFI